MERSLIPEVCEEACAENAHGAGPLTRRKFLRYAGIGTVGTTVILSGALDAFAASPSAALRSTKTNTSDPEPTGSESGEITLDGLMLTYFSLPPDFLYSTFTFGNNFSSAFTLNLPKSRGLSIAASAPAETVSSGSLTQHKSSWVKDAIALRSVEGQAGDKRERFSKQQASDPLQIYGLRKPKLRLTGSPDRLQFYFSNLGERSFNLGREVEPDTAASMYRQYITDPTLLFPPRFYWLDVQGGDGETTLDFALPSRLLVRNGITASATAKIVDQAGFRSQQLIDAFAPGNDVEITYHSAQEFPSKSLMELETTPARGNARIYIDRVFKTFVMTERGN